MSERDIFLAAIERPESEQAAYLLEACEGDADLYRRVMSLLKSHDAAGSFLGTPLVSPPDPDHAATRAFTPDVEPSVPRPSTDDEAEALAFLSPTSRPDSLGRIGHYEVLQVLGRGGFGIVFRAFDDILQRVVAVKVMAPPLAATSPARKRFLREARSSAQVRHENVVQVYEVGEKPLPHLVMEFIPGETLQARLNRTGPLDAMETVRIGRQIAEGLAAAHAMDLIHRDIKPGNVLIEGGQNRVKITDFGLARAADDASISQSGIIAGTPMYMSPEQALGHKLDQRTDLFSLGSVLYQMVAGRAPFRASGTLAVLKRVAEDTPRSIREIIPEAPPWLCDIIAKLHAKNPDERYPSARAVADVLADCEEQLKSSVKVKLAAAAPEVPLPPAKSGAWKWVAAAVVLLPFVAVAVTESTGLTRWIPRAWTTNDPNDREPEKPAPSRPLATFTNGIGMEFVLVPKGKAWLGGGKDGPGEKEVVIADEFYLGKYEVTQEQWEKLMGANPSSCHEGSPSVLPVETVTWTACQEFIRKLNQAEPGSAWMYRLPTEVEWEYACRGGPMTDKRESAFDFYVAKPTNALQPDQANFDKEVTTAVGSYPANRLGLFDMHGNVHEWCEDAVERNPGETKHAHRGGCWRYGVDPCRAGLSGRFPAEGASRHLGLRVARVPRPGSFTEADVQRMAARPAAEQVETVRRELKRRNPEFDGTLQPTLDGDRVVGLEFFTDKVSDITPVRALVHLADLNIRGNGLNRGLVSDLSPLRGLKLKKLSISVTEVASLEPLRGMPLMHLHTDNTNISDLAPLADMPLVTVNCSYTKIASLAPLKDAPLQVIWCNHTDIADLSPLKGKSLEWITFQSTKVTDITVLKGMPIAQTYLDYDAKRDREVLRGLTMLGKINDKPADDFWRDVDK